MQSPAWIRFWKTRLFRRNLPKDGWISLGQRDVYIFLSADGWRFCGLLLVIWIGSINYNLSLGYALFALLMSLLIVGMWETFRNQAKLKLAFVSCVPSFAGDPLPLVIRLHNPSKLARFGLVLRYLDPEKKQMAQVQFDLPAQTEIDICLPIPTQQRGLLALKHIQLRTTYPLGLLQAWSYCDFEVTGLVYPKPEVSAPPLPFLTGNPSNQGKQTIANGTDVSGLRPYQQGDTARLIAWKYYAKHGTLASKLTETQSADECELNWQQLPHTLSHEARISRLCAWILHADASHLRYRIVLPHQQFSLDNPQAQREACLRALAIFPAQQASFSASKVSA